MGAPAGLSALLTARTDYFLDREAAARGAAADELADVLARATWAPYEGVLSLGYGVAPFWIRVHLSAQEPLDAWVLRIRPAFLDEVRVHLPQPDGTHLVAHLGDRQPPPGGVVPDSALSLELQGPQAPLQQVVYLQIRTTSARMASVEAYSRAPAELVREREHTALGVYFGAMLCLVVWGLWHAVFDRDRVFAWFTAYQGAAVLMNLGLMGHARLYLPQDWSPDVWTTTFVLSIGILGPVFHAVFLGSLMGPRGLPASIRWLLRLTVGVGLFNLLQVAMDRVGPALAVNAILVTVMAFLVALLVVVEALRRPDTPLRGVLIAYALQCLAMLVTLLPLLGMLQGGRWTLFSTAAHGLMVAVVLAGALMARRAQLQQQVRQDQLRLLDEQARTQQALTQRDEKERFLAMLTHELRTPLSVIRMVLDSVGRRGAQTPARQIDLARSAVGDIDQVIERAVQVDRLEREELGAQRLSCDLREVLDLCVQGLPEGERARVRLSVRGAEAPAWPGETAGSGSGGPTRVMVDSDPLLLRVVVANLLDNALKYSPPESPVGLELQAEGPVVRVCNGPGRAGRPDPQRVFAKYYRSDGARRLGGSGLGLYLVDGLSRQLGLQVRCEPGRDEDPTSPVCFELRWRA